MQLFTNKSQLRELIEGISLSNEQAMDLCGRMAEMYREFAAPLPDSHPGKTLALKNSARMRDFVLEWQEDLQMTQFEAIILAFLAFSHGLGQFDPGPQFWALNTDDGSAGTPSEVAALQFARFILAASPRSLLGSPFPDVAAYAITHQPDVEMPPRNTYPNERWQDAAHELLGFLRDVLIYDNLLPECIRPKLENRQEKDECGEILPKSQLERFTRRTVLLRSECESYEAFMLEELSNVFKITTPAIAELTVTAGGPSFVLHYLQQRLTDKHEFQTIKNALFRWNSRLTTMILEGRA